MANGSARSMDYAFIGINMSAVKRVIVSTFLGGLKRGRMPKAVFIWGKPGQGKTFTAHAAAREIGRRLKALCVMADVAAGTCEPCDIAGVPFPVQINGTEMFARYLGTEWAWFASREYEEWERTREGGDPDFVAPPMLLFFDDLPAAHFQTQSAFFKGVHEGKWGSLHQRDNVMVVGAGNRVEDNAAANDMPTPLANRFRHCYANPSTSDWLKWAGEFREEGEPGVTGQSRIHPLVIGYIRTKQDALIEFNNEVAVRADKAFASPRTWEDISELLYEEEIGQEDELFGKVVRGIIGQGIGTEFIAYLQESTSLVPPEEIVKNPKRARIPSRKNLDALHATVASLELYLRQHPKHWKAGVQYALRKEMVSDVGILLAQTVCEVIQDHLEPGLRGRALSDDVFISLCERYEEILNIVEL